MKRLNPNDFRGPRSYFTDFDHRIVSRTDDLSTLKIHTERKLKLLLLIKSRIVCAASHLATEFAYEIFKDNPQLLRDGHIIPALRIDKECVSELFERKKFSRKDEILKYYEENIQFTVDWELEDNSAWFRDRFIEELDNPTSLIRKQLLNASTTQIPSTVIRNIQNEIRENRIISRSQIEHYAKDLNDAQKDLLFNFRELMYHLSGARVINCESSLPQENYIDYDIADLTGKRSRLSDEQILFKLFIELAFESMQKKMIPVELLDHLSFDDVLKIRQPILESDFQAKYDNLILRVIKGIKQDYSETFFDLNELENIRKHLEMTFVAIFEKELPSFIRKKNKEGLKNLGSVGSSVALGALGFIPEVSAIASGISVLKDSPASSSI
ncbi:hypothetical protein [Desulfosarcina cetonica]|uniref:hypothetical protein n=1 Tax=Desulfosarcina cetonica TaxID=90730 RepID=UPI0006CFC34D|nr:hypothetical protein [Desulfosarcina cetonica]